jgi:GAF domain
MRWFVEVSRVGESSLSEKYCVEAKQWQAALQEARKLRGDSGALSKFSIELLDDGYRAVDPSLKLRYLVNQAPGDAPLTPYSEESEPRPSQSNGKSSKARVGGSGAPTAFATSLAPESAAKPAMGSSIPRPTSHSPPRPGSNAPPRPTSNAPPRTQQLVVPDDPVPPAPRAPTGLQLEAEPAPVLVLVPVPAAAAPLLPSFDVVRERSEEPRAESPITYREVAYAVKPGTSRALVEALLWARYKDVAATIEERAPGKFIQLAVFDHSFQKRPERPPLATFAWKDWRGSPVLAFPGFGEAPAGPMSQVPPVPASQASFPPVPTASNAPQPAPAQQLAAAPAVPAAPTVSGSATSTPVVGSLPPGGAPVALVPVADPAVALGAPSPVSRAEPAAISSPMVAALIAAPLPGPAPAVAAEVPVAPLSPAAPAASSAPVLEVTFDSTPFNAAPATTRKSAPDSERQSRPRLAVAGRRRAGEDLIGELFEVMHDLHFMRDVAAGSEFVLSVLNEVLPCEGVLIHVFDINTNHFVVVRAKGPNAKGVLLQRMPDQDPLAQSVMRSAQAVSVKNAAHDARFNGPRWQAVGVAPRVALCGAVRQGGRYLGLIELVNPAGDTPFHLSELNAMDYICEQFAEFLSNRPIILAADVVLARL